MKFTKKIVAFGLAALLVLGAVLSFLPTSSVAVAAADASDEEASYSRVSVHDPSIIKDEQTGRYYIFGSHLAWAYSDDLINWTSFANNISTDYETLFATEAAWAAQGSSSYDLSGNMWAPDVIWNESMQKYCMYMSINGDNWYSSICLLTADSLDGDWTYVGTVTQSGLVNGAVTFDYEKVMGTTTIAERYSAKSSGGNATYETNCIDPCVTYDEEGNLWMTWGSWFGGIWMIELDESTGLRDYNVTYNYEEGDASTTTSDPYYGYRIAGGGNVSGEASYIEYIDGYYYLFVTYGALQANGGYNMRVFRSTTINGQYKDESGDDARTSISSRAGNISGSVGMRLMSYYKWSYWDYAQVAQGHNSVLYDEDTGEIYLVYHTRTNDGTEGHTVRVHQLFQNEDGWLVAAPFEYTEDDEISASGYSTDEIVGSYEVLIQTSNIDYASLEYVEPSYIVLQEDGTVSGDLTGSWTLTDGKPYITLTVGSETYKGVCLTQRVENRTSTAMTFTAVGTTSEVAIWGYRYDDLAVEMEISGITIPAQTVNGTDLDMKSDGTYGTTITWTSSNEAVIATDGTVTEPQGENVTVTLTAVITKGSVSSTQTYTVEVLGTDATDADGNITVWSSDATYDLTGAQKGDYSFPNYFNGESGTAGLTLYNGVSIEFTATRTGSYNYLGNILSFNIGGDNSGNIMYFTGGSYLGYNATGGYFDANVNYWSTGTDYIGENTAAKIKIEILPYTYNVYVNDELVYSMDTVADGTTAGSNSMDTIYSVLSYLSGTATEFDLGWGSWWDGGFNGTISDITLTAYAVADDSSDDNDYLYRETYSTLPATTGSSTGWVSANASSSLSVTTDDYTDWYLHFANSGASGNRGAYLLFNEGASLVSGTYTIEVDTALTAGVLTQRSVSEFAILGTDASGYTGNNGVTSGYILLLKNEPPEGTAANQTNTENQEIWYINGTEEYVTIPAGEWVHISADVDTDAGTAYVVITNRSTDEVYYEGTVTINGSGELMGLYLLNGRGIGTSSVDNILVTVADTESGDTETEDTESENTETEDTESENTETEDTENVDTETEETETADTETEETETETGDTESEDTEVEETEDTESEDTESVDTETGNSGAEETEDTETEEDSNEIAETESEDDGSETSDSETESTDSETADSETESTDSETAGSDTEGTESGASGTEVEDAGDAGSSSSDAASPKTADTGLLYNMLLIALLGCGILVIAVGKSRNGANK